ncbi:MAG: efflux transporter outer membrane subunit [Prevotella sp.]|nr:efflux transporter outer membrane subunit [Prevotella sp.]
MKNKVLCLGVLSVCLWLQGCKTPQATTTTSSAALQLPGTYHTDQDSVAVTRSQASAITPWRRFFTDATLEALIDTALVRNQDLKITLQQIAVAKSGVLFSQGSLLPTVTAGASASVGKVGRYTSQGAGDASTDMQAGKPVPDILGDFAPTLTASWEADLWHKLGTQKKAAVEQYLATVEGRNAVLSSLIAQVASNYYLLLALDNKLDMVLQYIDLQKKSLELAKIQKLADADTELAVQKFEAELAKAQSDEYALRQEIVETENALNLLLGRYPTPIIRNKTKLYSASLLPVNTGVPSELLLNRPDIRQAEHQLAAARWSVEAARKEFLPSLNISASLGLDAFNPTYLTRLPQSLAFSVLGGLTAPLINKKAIQANFQSADAQQVEALYAYDKALLTAYAEVYTLMRKNKNLEQYFELKKHESETLDRSVNIAHQLYMNNRSTYLDVLQDERDALQAKMELIEARQQQLTNEVDLYRAVGGGTDH